MTLKEARFKRGLAQFDLRIRSGIHQSKISLIETGRLIPRKDEIEKLTKALNLTPGELEFKNPVAQFINELVAN